ncbi:magnesium chelatase [Prosthecochloris sp. GSB1]|uniref:magnesium chelatase subunit D family protein n=1 Tax=Prosthecochloris sp. GSB1 TaxID=281093 RepID=UPI000B8CD5C9|nr:magnesium chelatase subunit D family protein [Prosthecochloris sp. GSB1]ASQ90371.1 magnesium chelatase [Prosthecochloris sp. GSB1]
MHSQLYPFAAVIGQEELKHALLLNAVNPRIGGVVIRGEKGTAKSTTVRALGKLLPPVDESAPEGEERSRVITLPLNATEDMVAGGIDFHCTMRDGCRVFQPGLLARADKGILYIDEVNLLDDHIVNLVLDAAASGENRVEREGISFCHLASFVLVGTMNPEEGELRPQLLDRFGFCVEVSAEHDAEKRVEMMLCRESFDENREAFIASYGNENERIAGKILAARRMLPAVRMPSHLRGFISELCRSNNVAGHRADLVIEQAARATAAYRGSSVVEVDDITAVASLALSHRRRDPVPPSPPPEPPRSRERQNQDEQPEQDRGNEEREQAGPDERQDDGGQGSPDGRSGPEERSSENRTDEQQQKDPEQSEDGDDADEAALPEQVFEIAAPFRVRPISSPKDRAMRRGSGKRSRSRVSQKQGRYTKSTMKRRNNDIALDATLRAAAPFQRHRENLNDMAVILHDEDIREKIREKRLGNLLIFVVDASGSMGAKGRMAASKGAVMSLLIDAYQKRDKLAMVSFRKDSATVNLPVTSSVELAAKLLREMPVGGRTPFSAGLVKGYEIARNHLLKEPDARPMIIMVTDGKANKALGDRKPLEEVFDLSLKIAGEERIRFLVVDTEEPGLVNFGLARKIAGMLQAEYFKIDDLQADTLLNIVKNTTS